MIEQSKSDAHCAATKAGINTANRPRSSLLTIAAAVFNVILRYRYERRQSRLEASGKGS
jgi:hypothetical protein